MVCNLGRWVRSLAYAIGSRVQPVAECAAMFVHSISITKCSDEKGPNPVELQLLFLCFFMHHLVAFWASSMVHFIAPSTPFLLRMEIWRFALCPWFLHSHRLHERCTGGDWKSCWWSKRPWRWQSHHLKMAILLKHEKHGFLMWVLEDFRTASKTQNRKQTWILLCGFLCSRSKSGSSWSSLKENGVRLADIFAMVYLWFSIWFCEVFYGFCILCSRGCNKKSLGHLRWPKFGPAK